MTSKLIIQNLKCGGCATTIKKQLSQLSDVNKVIVDLDLATVKFHYTMNDTLIKVSEKLKQLGYPIGSEENGLASRARSFVSCGLGRLSKSEE